jgi:NAD-dependent dihydropyrimidine dehydrogenase PreA subunit
LERITQGKGKAEDIPRLERLALAVKDGSLCGLGQTAPNPVLTTLRYFRDEYEAHILERRCPAGQCSALLTYYIDAELCTGCRACTRVCPAEAITGEKKEPHVIDPEKCISCGNCVERCKFDAIKTK